GKVDQITFTKINAKSVFISSISCPCIFTLKEQQCWSELDDIAPTLNSKSIKELSITATTDLFRPCESAMVPSKIRISSLNPLAKHLTDKLKLFFTSNMRTSTVASTACKRRDKVMSTEPQSSAM
uniref:Uncharacterized protein n=1 Tax=Triticum urartu TaxID=4572 RepID=A0A8R7RAX9_TRIUA